MHYFSKLTPTQRVREKVAQSGRRLYGEHNAIWRLFPDWDGERNFIYRWDEDAVWLISERQPSNDADFDVQTRPYKPDLVAGDKLHFRMRVNPVVRRIVNGKQRKCDVVMDLKSRTERGEKSQHDLTLDASWQWLEKSHHLEAFSVEKFGFAAEQYQQHRFKRRSQEIRFSSVDLSGVMTVVSPGKTTDFLLNGIGSSKAFGCGLILVRRA